MAPEGNLQVYSDDLIFCLYHIYPSPPSQLEFPFFIPSRLIRKHQLYHSHHLGLKGTVADSIILFLKTGLTEVKLALQDRIMRDNFAETELTLNLFWSRIKTILDALAERIIGSTFQSFVTLIIRAWKLDVGEVHE